MKWLFVIPFFLEMSLHFVVVFFILLIENLTLFVSRSKLSFEKFVIVKDYLLFVNKRKSWYVKRLIV